MLQIRLGQYGAGTEGGALRRSAARFSLSLSFSSLLVAFPQPCVLLPNHRPTAPQPPGPLRSDGAPGGFLRKTPPPGTAPVGSGKPVGKQGAKSENIRGAGGAPPFRTVSPALHTTGRHPPGPGRPASSRLIPRLCRMLCPAENPLWVDFFHIASLPFHLCLCYHRGMKAAFIIIV